MTNIANERGEVLNSVLTTGEGPAWEAVCQGIVRRYRDAGEPEPSIIYVDRDCCSQSGQPAIMQWFKPWKTVVRLDIFHFMRRFTKGLTTEHHPLYGTFCSKLSSCIFTWDREDYTHLREAKKCEMMRRHIGMVPSEKQITAAITPSELARHCRRQTRPVAVMENLINSLLSDQKERLGLLLLLLKEAKKCEIMRRHIGMVPSEKQITAAITPSELARHCRRQTRPVAEMEKLINRLLSEIWGLTDTNGIRLINPNSMECGLFNENTCHASQTLLGWSSTQKLVPLKKEASV
ncbi:hypothetical protein ACF0H5_001757 [Mactra antiquata]